MASGAEVLSLTGMNKLSLDTAVDTARVVAAMVVSVLLGAVCVVLGEKRNERNEKKWGRR